MNKRQQLAFGIGTVIFVCVTLLLYGIQPITIASGYPGTVVLEPRHWDHPILLCVDAIVAIVTLTAIFLLRK